MDASVREWRGKKKQKKNHKKKSQQSSALSVVVVSCCWPPWCETAAAQPSRRLHLVPGVMAVSDHEPVGVRGVRVGPASGAVAARQPQKGHPEVLADERVDERVDGRVYPTCSRRARVITYRPASNFIRSATSRRDRKPPRGSDRVAEFRGSERGKLKVLRDDVVRREDGPTISENSEVRCVQLEIGRFRFSRTRAFVLPVPRTRERFDRFEALLGIPNVSFLDRSLENQRNFEKPEHTLYVTSCTIFHRIRTAINEHICLFKDLRIFSSDGYIEKPW